MDLALLFMPIEEMGLMLGYKSWRYEDDDSSLDGVQHLDMRFDGLFVGMLLRF